MVETVRYSKGYLEDLAIGTGTQAVRLADGSMPSLTEIHLARLLQTPMATLRATDFNGQGVMTWANALPAGARIWGVTIKILDTFGTSNGLTGLLVGDALIPDRWSNAPLALIQDTESDQGDFTDESLMIMATAGDVTITATDGLFDAVGRIEVAVHTSILRHPG